MNPLSTIFKLIKFLIKLTFRIFTLGLMLIGIASIIIAAVYYIDPTSLPLLKAKKYVLEQAIQRLEESGEGKANININIYIDDVVSQDKKESKNDLIFPEYLKREAHIGKEKQTIVANPNSLVFSGGGPRGIAYAGVLKYMQEHNKLKNVKRFIGTSAGSIMCTFMSIGTYYEQNREAQSEPFSKVVDKIMLKTNFIDFIDNPILKNVLTNMKTKSVKLDFQDLYECFQKITGDYALCKGTVILNFYKNAMKQFGLDENITLKELYKKTGNHLILVSCSLSYKKTAYFDYLTAPDMPVVLAMKASMSIPFIFEPTFYNDDYFIDGGAANNYPINYFDYTEKGEINNSVSCLGFVLTSKKKILRPERSYIDNLGNYTISVFSLLMLNTDAALYKKNIERTVFIDCGKITSLSFDITDKEKRELIQAGYKAISIYYNQ